MVDPVSWMECVRKNFFPACRCLSAGSGPLFALVITFEWERWQGRRSKTTWAASIFFEVSCVTAKAVLIHGSVGFAC